MSSSQFNQKYSVKEGFSAVTDSKFMDEIQHKKNILQRIKSGQKGLSSFEQDLQSRHQRNGQTIESYKENSNLISNRASNSNFNMSSPGVAQRLTTYQGPQDLNNPMLAYAAKDTAAQSFAQPSGTHAIMNPTLRYTNSQQALANNRFETQIDSGRDKISGDIQSQQIEGFIGNKQLNTISEDSRQRVAENFNQYHQKRNQGDISGPQFTQAWQLEQMDKRSAVATEDEDRIQKRHNSKDMISRTQRQQIGLRSVGGSSAGSKADAQATLSPPRQNFVVPRDSTLGSSNGRGHQARHRVDSLERQAAQSYPLRKPSISPSINLSQHSKSPTLTGRNAGLEQVAGHINDPRLLRRESLRQSGHSSSSHSPTSRVSSQRKLMMHQINPPFPSRQQLGENPGAHGFQGKHPSPIYPIAEQDTTQEISSIDPHGVSAQQRDNSVPMQQNGYYVAMNNDESQYVFTSAQHSQSIVDAQPNGDKFQFNSGALADSPHKAVMYEPGFNDPRAQFQVDGGGLSEPQLATDKPSHSKRDVLAGRTGDSAAGATSQSQDFREQIQTLVRHEQYICQPPEQNQKHHAGGSFGNLKDFGPAAGGNNSNTLASIQKMLEPRSQKIDGDYTTGQTQGFGSAGQGVAFAKRDSEKQRSKVRIMLSEGQEAQEGFDSSLEFKTRKYNIIKNISSEHMGAKSRGRLGGKRGSKHNQQSSGESEPVNQKASRRQSRRSNASGSKERGKKASKRKKRSSRNQDSSLSESGSGLDHNDSQISLSQKSRDSYGKYFMRSRSKADRRQKSQKGSARRSLSKKGRKGGDRSARSMQSASKSRERLSRDKRSRSAAAESRGKKSRTKSMSKDGVNLAQVYRGSKRTKLNGSADARHSSRKSRHSSRSRVKIALSRDTLRATGGNFLGKPSHQVSTAHSFKRAVVSSSSNALRPPIAGLQRNHMSTLQPFAQLSTIESVARRRHSACRTIQAGASSLPRTKRITGSRTRRSERGGNTNNSALLDPRSGETLAQRLLIDLAKKYRSMGEKQAKDLQGHISGHPVAAKAQQQQLQQMIQEIQSLAVALIRSEKRIAKTKAEKGQTVKKLKGIIEDQEECIALLQQKAAKLGSRNDKLQRNEVQLSHDMQREEQKIGYELAERDLSIRDLEKKLLEGKTRGEREKREIIIAMERDLQAQAQQLQKKSEIKISSLKSVNDQLNVRLQELSDIERAHGKLSAEYNQSLQLLNDFQEQVSLLDHANRELKAQSSDILLELDHVQVQSKEREEESNKKIESMLARHEQRIAGMKKEHLCALQKCRITQGATEDSQRYRFEEEVTELQMNLQKKEELLEESGRQLDALREQIGSERADQKMNEAAVAQQLKDSEEQRERIELEAKDLESQVQHLQRVIQQKDEELGVISSNQPALPLELSSSSDSDKDNLIRSLKAQLDKKERQAAGLQNRLSDSENQRQVLQEESERQAQGLQAKVELQQQEIQILAQGFQAQQMKLSTQMKQVARTGNFGGLVGRNNIKIDEAHQSSLQSLSSLSGPGPNSDIKDVARSARDKGSSAAMNIQPNYTPREHPTSRSSHPGKLASRPSGSSQQQTERGASSSEASDSARQQTNLYFQNNHYRDNRNQIIAEAKQARHSYEEVAGSQGRGSHESSKFINTCSLSSTGKQLEYMGTSGLYGSSVDQLHGQKFQYMQGEQPKNITTLLIQDDSLANDSKSYIEEESTPETSSRADCEDPRTAYQDQLGQKDEEIKILWSVISQMRGGSCEKEAGMQTLGSFGGPPGETTASNAKAIQQSSQLLTGQVSGDIMNTLTVLGHGHTNSAGNQSSIMGILAPNQYTTGETSGSALVQSDLTSGPLSGTIGKNIELSTGQDHLTEPVLVDKSQDLRQSRDSVKSVSSKQELIDVKKRIQKLMGPKIGGKTSSEYSGEAIGSSRYKTQHQPQNSYGESSKGISKFASGVVSEGIDEYCQNKQV